MQKRQLKITHKIHRQNKARRRLKRYDDKGCWIEGEIMGSPNILINSWAVLKIYLVKCRQALYPLEGSSITDACENLSLSNLTSFGLSFI